MSTKYVSRSFNNTSYTIEETTVCPHCAKSIFPNTSDYKSFSYTSDIKLWGITYRCPAPDCNKIFLAVFLGDIETKKLELNYIYPNRLPETLHPLLQDLSPRFIEAYRQANIAENHNCFELAGSGYRNAIEILIKDFAINELKKDESEVSKKKLHICIKDYLSDVDLTTSADVVRILGNDNTHYERKYEELDFNILKTYMNIFIQLITTKLLINHPPVGNR